MCGINGIIFFKGPPAENEQREIILKMNTAIAHRGPDGEGMFCAGNVALGHRRLSIIDLTPEGNQPMFNEDRSIVIVYNGEIYNYKELIPVLAKKGHRFRSSSDTEVVLHAYEEYGEDCVKMFNGMWAFAIYDMNEHKLFFSRDRFGVKPFYYYKDESRFIFSSELKAILQAVNVTEANHGKVYEYIAYGYKTTDGDTFFSGINELLPGNNLTISNGQITARRYWEISRREGGRSDGEAGLRELMEDAVRIRFRSDVPVSLLLSGGIDSGIIAGITNSLIEGGELPDAKVSSYSAVFPGFEFDESEAIKEILRLCPGISGNFVTPDSGDLTEKLEQFVYAMGEPVFSSTSFAHSILMKCIADNGVKVVLNGQGADEAWCGYGRYIIGYFLLDTFVRSPGKFMKQFRLAGKNMEFSSGMIIGQLLKSLMPRQTASFLRAKYSEGIIEALNANFVRENAGRIRDKSDGPLSGRSLSGYMLHNISYQGFGQILHYEDHSSMMNSVEIRSPFIDYRVMELAFSVPDEAKLYDGITKKILRETFASLLPEGVVNAKRKIGFVTPFEKWAQSGEFSRFASKIFGSDEFLSRKLFNEKILALKINSSKRSADFPLWRLLNLELWTRAYGIRNL